MTDALFTPGPEHLGATLRDRFIEPPLSVLDRRGGAWQTRKRQWMALGIQSELGRGDTGRAAAFNTRGTLVTKPVDGRLLESNERLGSLEDHTNLSIFDPVLCEIAYTWWTPPGGRIIDNFAGGSVRGIVASKLGHHYTGIDLSSDQVDANRVQARTLLDADDPQARWLVGDAVYITDVLGPQDPPYDFAFTCPPYYDLEVYSDDPRDLSAQGTYVEFLAMYRAAIRALADHLAYDRFAAIVVGDVRQKSGIYHGLVVDTVDAYQRAGLHLYNEACLIDPYINAPQRASAGFPKGRKLTRVHQTMLVFVKGDWRKAAAACAGERVHNTARYDVQQPLFDGGVS